MTTKKTAITTPRGRRPLPNGGRKDSIYVGLLPSEIVGLDKQCIQESKESGVTITRSELLRKAWLEYQSKREGAKAK